MSSPRLSNTWKAPKWPRTVDNVLDDEHELIRHEHCHDCSSSITVAELFFFWALTYSTSKGLRGRIGIYYWIQVMFLEVYDK